VIWAQGSLSQRRRALSFPKTACHRDEDMCSRGRRYLHHVINGWYCLLEKREAEKKEDRKKGNTRHRWVERSFSYASKKIEKGSKNQDSRGRRTRDCISKSLILLGAFDERGANHARKKRRWMRCLPDSPRSLPSKEYRFKVNGKMRGRKVETGIFGAAEDYLLRQQLQTDRPERKPGWPSPSYVRLQEGEQNSVRRGRQSPPRDVTSSISTKEE